MTVFMIQAILHIICFCVCFYALQALDFNRFLKQGRVMQAQLLMLLLAMALAHLTARFLMALSNTMYFY